MHESLHRDDCISTVSLVNRRNEQLGETELDEDTVLLNSQSDSHSARYPETQAGDSTGLSLFQHPSQSSADEEFEEIEDFDD